MITFFYFACKHFLLQVFFHHSDFYNLKIPPQITFVRSIPLGDSHAYIKGKSK